MNARLSAAYVVTALALAMLTGCSSSSKTTGAPASPARTAVAAATASAGSTTAPASTSTSIDVCTAVPAATVVRLSGKPYTVATPVTSGLGLGCAYDDVTNSDGGVTLTVSFTKAEDTWQAVHTGSITNISGVGDKAFWDNDNTVYAVSGSTIIQVNGLDSQAPSVALAKALLAAIH